MTTSSISDYFERKRKEVLERIIGTSVPKKDVSNETIHYRSRWSWFFISAQFLKVCKRICFHPLFPESALSLKGNSHECISQILLHDNTLPNRFYLQGSKGKSREHKTNLSFSILFLSSFRIFPFSIRTSIFIILTQIK